VVAERFQERPFLAPVWGKFNQRLQEPFEKFLPPQSIFIEVFVHFVDITAPPKMD
jgi:hypothetical protein